MYQIEIVRLCAIWDGIDLDKENIPTVVALIDDDAIIEMLAEETRSQQEARKTCNSQTSTHRWHEPNCWQAIEATRTVLNSPRLASIMNLRNKHLAHSLEITRRDKNGPVQPMKYGDETELLDASIPIIERLAWRSRGERMLSRADPLPFRLRLSAGRAHFKHQCACDVSTALRGLGTSQISTADASSRLVAIRNIWSSETTRLSCVRRFSIICAHLGRAEAGRFRAG